MPSNLFATKMIGQSIAHYRVTAKIGAGGMGEVYRATDTKLGRDVALKVLSEAFAADQQRMGRFQREAQVLASLNHPHIATIHGLEESGAVRALVMELVEGPTLADRIAQGALPLEEALPIARQIAEALEYAHEKGIIHRDLKPANIKLTAEGQVKVLDFGLAKALAEDSSVTDVASSPTLSMAATRAGIILGTAAYMSPEQAKGKTVDRRADVWSFGAVLFEMLAGRRAFHGEDASDILASVIKTDPDWNALPAATPAPIRKLLRRCMEKDAKRRLQAIGEARIQLEEIMAEASAPSAIMSAPATARAATPGWQRVLPWAVAGVMTLVAAAAMWQLTRAPGVEAPGITRLTMGFRGLENIAGACCGRSFAISPDGRRLALVGRAGGKMQIHLRSMDRLDLVPLAGTEDAATPFFSPDSQWIAFFSGGQLKKVPVEGGTPLALCSVGTDPRGGSWGPDDTIVFAGAGNAGLSRVSANGGTPESLTQLDATQGDTSHRWPEVLPGGKTALFAVERSGRFAIEAVSLETRARKPVVKDASQPTYSPTGHLVYSVMSSRDSGATAGGSSGGILAAPFDAEKAEVTGSAIPVLENVFVFPGGASLFAFSRNGTLLTDTSASTMAKNTLAWVDRKGVVRPISSEHRPFHNPRLTPDGKRVVVEIQERAHNLWVFDLARGTLSRLTFEGDNHDPVSTPDGARVVYSSRGPSALGLYWRRTDGTGEEEKLLEVPGRAEPGSWSPDGKLLAYGTGAVSPDIWLLPMEGERKPRPFLQSKFFEFSPRFSPDGRWLAYTSNESGSFEVYVQAVSGEAGKWQVSTEGGENPVWSPGGKELFYTKGNQMMAVDVRMQPTLQPGKPRLLFAGNFEGGFDVAPDGQHFIVVQPAEESQQSQPELQVTFHWFEDVRRRVPTGKK